MIDEAAETPRVRDIRGMAREERTGDPGTLMKPAPESSTQEVLAGLVERVTFHNPESGFCVLRAKARGHRDLVTVVGHAAMTGMDVRPALMVQLRKVHYPSAVSCTELGLSRPPSP